LRRGVPVDHLERGRFGFEKNMTSEEVKQLIEPMMRITPAGKEEDLNEKTTCDRWRLWPNNRRVDVTIGTLVEHGPFAAFLQLPRPPLTLLE